MNTFYNTHGNEMNEQTFVKWVYVLKRILSWCVGELACTIY